LQEELRKARDDGEKSQRYLRDDLESANEKLKSAEEERRSLREQIDELSESLRTAQRAQSAETTKGVAQEQERKLRQELDEARSKTKKQERDIEQNTRQLEELRRTVGQQDDLIKQQQNALQASVLEAESTGEDEAPPPPPGGAPPPPPPAAPTGAASGSRTSLLDSIRKPEIALKKTQPKEAAPKPVEVDDGNVLNIIAHALIARRTAIKEDESGPYEEEGEWEEEEEYYET